MIDPKLFDVGLLDPRYLIQIPFGQDENLIYISQKQSGGVASAWDRATDQLAAINPLSKYIDDTAIITNAEGIEETYGIAFVGAEIIRINGKPVSKVMEHPSQTSEVRIDHKIDLPTEFSIEIIASPDAYRAVWLAVNTHRVAGTNLTLQTKVNTWGNLIVLDMPHEESAEKFNTFSMTITMRQIIVADTSALFTPTDASNSSTINTGTKQGLEVFA